MALTYEIDSERRLVIAHARGVLTQDDIIEFQKSVWSRPDVMGFDEIVDVTGVEKFDYQSGREVREIAVLSATMDAGVRSRIALVAKDPSAYGLARMFQLYRELQPNNNKTIQIFRSADEAMAWLTEEHASVPPPDKAN